MAEQIGISGNPNPGMRAFKEAIANGELVGDSRHPKPGDKIKIMQVSDSIKAVEKYVIKPAA